MKFFTPMFESIADHRKIVLMMLSIEIDIDFLKECDFSKKDFERLCIEFKLKIRLKALDLKIKYCKFFKCTQTAENKVIKPGFQTATPLISAAVAARIKNPQMAQKTNINFERKS